MPSFPSFFLLLCSVSTTHKHGMRGEKRWIIRVSRRKHLYAGSFAADRWIVARIIGIIRPFQPTVLDSHGSETRYEHDCKSVNMLMKTRGSLTFEISMPDYIASWKRVAVPISIPIGMRAPSYFLRAHCLVSWRVFATIYLNRSRTSSIGLDGRGKMALFEEERTTRMLTERIQAKVFPARLVCKEKSINEPFRSFQGISNLENNYGYI